MCAHKRCVFTGWKANFITIIICDFQSLVTHRLCKQRLHTLVIRAGRLHLCREGFVMSPLMSPVRMKGWRISAGKKRYIVQQNISAAFVYMQHFSHYWTTGNLNIKRWQYKKSSLQFCFDRSQVGAASGWPKVTSKRKPICSYI